MDNVWAADQLRRFVNDIEFIQSVGTMDFAGRSDHENDIAIREPIAQMIMKAVDPGLEIYEDENWWLRLSLAKAAALRALGLCELGAEAKTRLRSDAPTLAADQLHDWVWSAAQPLWESGNHQEAVEAACRSVNSRLQQKVLRRDVSEADLVRQAFTQKPAEPGKARLRFPGDRSSQTWSTRQDGALEFGAGCFRAIRNPAAHVHDLDLPEQVALEQLASLSLLSRWVDECELEVAVDDVSSSALSARAAGSAP